MRKTSIALLVGALVITASLIIGPAASAKSERANAATVVFIHDQEPPNLQGPWVGNNLYATQLVLNNIWYGGQIRDSKGDFVPRLFTAAPKIVKAKPLTVQATFRPDAVWSDGKQVTGKDFVATWKVFINPKFNVISRTGWEDIKSVKVSGKGGKTFTVVFKRHVRRLGVARFRRRLRGKHRQRSGHEPDVPELRARFERSVEVLQLAEGCPDHGRQERQVQGWHADEDRQARVPVHPRHERSLPGHEGRRGSGHGAAAAAPDRRLPEGQEVRRRPPDRLRMGAPGHPVRPAGRTRAQAAVRPAGAHHRHQPPQIANALYATIAPGLPALYSHMFKPFESTYKKNWAVYKFSQTKVIAILKAHGCTGGPDKPAANNSDIFSCPNVGKLSFRFGTTTGNQLRALTFEIMQRQLKSVGIELVPRFQVAGTLFGTTLPSGDWDLLLFTWVGSPGTQITVKDLYACGGEENYMNYCNTKFTKVLNAVANTLSASDRAKMLNAAEAKYMVKDIPSIPVYARPMFVIHAASR